MKKTLTALVGAAAIAGTLAISVSDASAALHRPGVPAAALSRCKQLPTMAAVKEFDAVVSAVDAAAVRSVKEKTWGAS